MHVALTALTLLGAASAAGPTCQLYYNASTVGVPGITCWKWDLSKVPAHTWVGHGGSTADNNGTWAVPNPCGTASPVTAGCTSGATPDAVAYQVFASSDPNKGIECVPAGSIHSAAFTPYGSTIDSGSAFLYQHFLHLLSKPAEFLLLSAFSTENHTSFLLGQGVHVEYYGPHGSFACLSAIFC